MLYQLVLVALAALAASQPVTGDVEMHYFEARHYNVIVEPFPKINQYTGKLELEAECRPKNAHQSCQEFWIHVACGLKINRIQVYRSDGKTAIKFQKPVYVNSLWALFISFEHELNPEDRIKLLFEYTGPLNQNNKGLYTDSMTTAVLTDIRRGRVFPLLESAATYQLTLVHDADLTSASITDISDVREMEDGKKRVQFKTTPEISTEQFGFIVGKYETVECKVVRGEAKPLVTAYVPVGSGAQAKLAVETVCKAIPLIEEYFERRFPLDKLILTSTVSSFGSDYESWGLIMLEEKLLLIDTGSDSRSRRDAANTICRLLLRQYFYGLELWDFSSDSIYDAIVFWYSHRLVQQIYPEFNNDVDCILRDKTNELSIYYSPPQEPTRAACMIRLLNAYIGPDVFRNCLAKLVSDYRGRSIRRSDISTAINTVSGGKLGSFFKKWDLNGGVPLISVKLTYSGRLLVQQSLMYDTMLEPRLVPLIITFSGLEGQSVINKVMLKKYWISVDPPTWFHDCTDCWVTLDNNLSSFYRTEYSEKLMERLTVALRNNKLSVADRINLVDDAGALYYLAEQKNDQRANSFIEKLGWFDGEKNGAVWSALVRAIDILSIARKTEASELASKLFANVANFSVEDDAKNKLAQENGLVDVLLLLIRLNDEKTIKEAVQRFDKTDYSALPMALQLPLFAAVIRENNPQRLSKLFRHLNGIRSRIQSESSKAKFNWMLERIELFIEENQPELLQIIE